MKPLRVVHDHALLGDAAYFANGCGALIGFANRALTFTPSGGESPLVIPAGEVSDIRLNAVVGKESAPSTLRRARDSIFIWRQNPASGRTHAPPWTNCASNSA